MDGDGKSVQPQQIPSTYDRFGIITDWVENNKAPGKSIAATAGDRTMPICSYPAYPKYVSGPAGEASSYNCSTR